MKIGILTYHRSINYGAVMQAYALACRLNEMNGVVAEIIDYTSPQMDIYYCLFTLYRGKRSLFQLGARLQMYRAFNKTINKLPLSLQKLKNCSQKKFYRHVYEKYDLIVVGSDAVWNYEKRGLPNPYFLLDSTGSKHVSYAASCNGINYNRLDEEKLSILKQAFERFEYLGVRDTLTENVVFRALGEHKTKHNCDPTLLLNFEKDGLNDSILNHLRKKLINKYGASPNKKYIGLMLSNLNGDLAKVLVAELKKRYADTHQIVSIYSYCAYADIPYVADLTPFEWARIFSLFDITFTKYFHGTLLSLKNLTPVISLSAEKSLYDMPAKVEDVLKRMNLLDFYWPARNAADISWECLMQKVDSLICIPPKEKMRQAVDKEATYANDFFDYLKNILT